MGRIISLNRREIASDRLKFLFYEVVPILLIIFVFLVAEWMILPLIVNQSSALFEILFYLIRALLIFVIVITFFYVYNIIKTKKKKLAEDELPLHIGFLRLYTMTRKNYLYQFLYSLLLFFLILIPLEASVLIAFPQMISYSTSIRNSFLLFDNFWVFLISSIVIQFSISFSDNTIFRGLITKRGSEHFHSMSAVMISSVYFAFVETILRSFFFTINFYIGIIWFIKSFVIGLVLSLTIMRRKWLLPLIIAKTVTSVIINIVIWELLHGEDIIQILIFFFTPFLIISLILLILQHSRVKESLQIGIEMLKSYFQNDRKKKESSGDKIFRILFDFFLSLLLFLFGILISV